MILLMLTASSLRARKIRSALTILAVVASVSLVVAVTSGYATMKTAAYRYLAQFMGATDAVIVLDRNGARGGIDASLLKAVADDPDVRGVTSRLELMTTLPAAKSIATTKADAPIVSSVQVIGIRLPDDAQVMNQRLHEGTWFKSDTGDVAVIDQVAQEKMRVRVGDTIELPGRYGKLAVQIVGVVHKPSFLAAHVQTIYLPLRTMQAFAFPENPEQFSRLRIDLDEDAKAQVFAERWRAKLQAINPLLQLRLADENRQTIETHFAGIRLLSMFGGTISMLAAAFIVFSALSMGVVERQRTLAMLRAIGVFRAQLGLLVLIEGIILAIIGAALGVPLGWLWVKILFALPMFKDVVSEVVLDWPGVIFGAGGSILAAIAASLLPAWSAVRTDPLSAMNPHATPPARKMPWLYALAGLLLLCVDPLLVFWPFNGTAGMSDALFRAVQLYGHYAVGIPCVMFGFFLLAPLIVRFVETVFGPMVAAMFGLRFTLLRQQLSSGVWRAAGTGAALMVGLAVLIAMNTQGNSALSAWKLPDKFPDVFLILRNGLAPQEAAKLEQVEGIKNHSVMPIAIASPGLGNNFLAIAGAALMPDKTMFFGMDPDKMRTMMELDFREGSPESARDLLKQGRHIIITEEFHKLKGLGVGDTMQLKTPVSGTVDYTIAGVVWSPGMDVMATRFDMGRQLDERTAASVFGSMDDAVRDFGVKETVLFAANLEPFTSKEQIVERARVVLGTDSIDIADVRELKHDIQQGFGRLLLLASTVAYAAMAVASLGVTNTIMASIRSRRWQFGILRAVGVTRGQLLRLVIAEALLLGGVGAAMGLAAGLFMCVNANRLSLAIVGFQPPIVVPWDVVAIGVGAVIAISLLSSLWPAIHVARTQPLALLQAGRASA